MHPDKGGDPEKFKELTKAYKALTDEEARNNWKEYGNPDGPGGNFNFCIFNLIKRKSYNLS
jgi:preprotein translocase subunit Sec63